MKRTLALLLCAFMIFTLSSCRTPDDPEDTTPSPSYAFISQTAKKDWKDDLVSILSGVDVRDPQNSIQGSYAVGLMDLNFDNSPEVFVAYPGGSMGNVYVEIYDLKAHSLLAIYDAAHFEDPESIRLYVAAVGDGFVTLAEGGIRDPESGWVSAIDLLHTELPTDGSRLNMENLFATAEKANADGDGPYFVKGESVEKQIYDEQYALFLTEYKKIASTELRLIKWSSLNLGDKSDLPKRMADALIRNSQSFISFK